MERREMVQQYLRILDLEDRNPDRDFLDDLVGRHVANFAFSSVGCRLGDDLPLAFAALFDRIIARRRGGYCFEQNGLLYGVLEELGFPARLYLARVIYNQTTHPGLTHRITMVEHEGERCVLDVGFGPLGPRAAVAMSGQKTDDGFGVFRIAEPRPDEFHLQVMKDGDFFSLYRFELARYGQADCEVGHFYSHRHPEASFVNHLVVSLSLPAETRSLRDLDYHVITSTDTTDRRIDGPQQLTRTLVEELGIRITDPEGRRLYEELIADGQAGS